MDDKKPGRGADQFPLRFPEGMRGEIKKLADQDGQSMNTKIIELLDHAIKHPIERWRNVLAQVQDLDAELDVVYNKYQFAVKYADKFKSIVDGDSEFQKKLMYQVLNYLDSIPVELAIWAYDMISIVERGEMRSYLEEHPDQTEEDFRNAAREQRDAYRAEVLSAIRKMREGDDDKV